MAVACEARKCAEWHKHLTTNRWGIFCFNKVTTEWCSPNIVFVVSDAYPMIFKRGMALFSKNETRDVVKVEASELVTSINFKIWLSTELRT